MVEASTPQRDAALWFGVRRNTISSLWRRFQTTWSGSDRSRSGHPRVTSQRQDQYIRVTHLRNRFRTASVTWDCVGDGLALDVPRFVANQACVGQNEQTVETTTKPARHAGRTWREIPQAFHDNLVASMRRRCQECVNARGGHTHYCQCELLFDPHCVVTSWKITSIMLNPFRLHGHSLKLSINVVTQNCTVWLRIVKMAAPCRVHRLFFASIYIHLMIDCTKPIRENCRNSWKW